MTDMAFFEVENGKIKQHGTLIGEGATEIVIAEVSEDHKLKKILKTVSIPKK